MRPSSSTSSSTIRWSAVGGRVMRLRRPVVATVAGAVLTLWATPTCALQLIEARDGVAVEAILSLKEPTRIRIEGAPITDVFGNLQSSNCGVAAAAAAGTGIPMPAMPPTGEIVLECDRDKGEIYIRPVSSAPDGKPANLFISSALATYTLVLRRSDTPADTIVIRDKTPRQAHIGASTSGPASPSANHIRSMKAMLVAMASDRVPADIHVDEVNRPMQLWAEVAFSLIRRYEGRGLVGEKYLLQNVTSSVMVLAEPEFDRPDSKSGGQVIGVAVEHHNLRPGETTSVFVIRRGGEQ